MLADRPSDQSAYGAQYRLSTTPGWQNDPRTSVEVFARRTDLRPARRGHIYPAVTTQNSDPLCHLAPPGDLLLRNSGLTPLPSAGESRLTNLTT